MKTKGLSAEHWLSHGSAQLTQKDVAACGLQVFRTKRLPAQTTSSGSDELGLGDASVSVSSACEYGVPNSKAFRIALNGSFSLQVTVTRWLLSNESYANKDMDFGSLKKEEMNRSEFT